MATTIISFRLETEVYLKLEAIAAEAGVSPGIYLKDKLESNANDLVSDIKLIKNDLKDIIQGISEIDNTDNKTVDSLTPLLLETLLILRKVAKPQKVEDAQNTLVNYGYNPYKSTES